MRFEYIMYQIGIVTCVFAIASVFVWLAILTSERNLMKHRLDCIDKELSELNAKYWEIRRGTKI